MLRPQGPNPMLFNLCACTVPLAGSAAPLCAGGAGFVTAMMAALAAASRTAPARPLRGNVPQVDRVAVRIVTDNIVIQFVPNETRDGLVIERKSGNTRPDRPPRTILNGEWGLAMHAQSSAGGDERNVLIDFGYTPEVLNNNLAVLGVDPAAFDAMVLSHGHYDHFGGMVGFLEAHGRALKTDIPFYVGGEDAFCIRRNPGGQFGALDRSAILQSGLTLMKAAEPAVVADHAFTTGRIGQTSFEKPLLPTTEIVGIEGGFGCFTDEMPAAKNTGAYIPDDFEHEIATVYNVKGRGLVVLTSCSHRGVINTVRAAIEASGIDRILAVVGGFHVVPPLGDDYIDATIEEFRALDPRYIVVGHCTGDRFYDLARAALGAKVIHSAVGMRLTFEGA
jgi:7,8-dihydropterin-6-yl-methyl-4-(beta-D-ribofuranosyl)aminobenzene 5'-phosphate synthase